MPKHDPAPAFRALHQRGNPFVLANAWDIGSAKMLAALGAQAIGTTSAGFCHANGKADMGKMTRDEALAHASDLVGATNLPVSGDFENGFGDAPDVVADTVRLSAEAGLAGICIEDTALPAMTPYDFDLAVERIRAAVSAARALPQDFVLVARADGMMNGQYDNDEAIKRLLAFEAAGADCLYAPIPPRLDDLARICSTIKAPVNALAAGPYTQYTRAQFAQIGVARISLGSALSRRVQQAMIDAARPIFDDGAFEQLGGALSGKDIEAMMADGATR